MSNTSVRWAMPKSYLPGSMQYMENIHASAVQMRRIIDTFLNVRRPEDVTSGAPRTAHLNVIASAVASQFDLAIERKEAGLELQLNEALPAAACDAIHAYQAMTNYVSNALGTINPVEEIIRLAHQQGIPVIRVGAKIVVGQPDHAVASHMHDRHEGSDRRIAVHPQRSRPGESSILRS